MSPSLSVFLLIELLRDISMLFLFILATSAWVLLELWGGGIPTSEISHFILRLRRLLLLFNLALPPHLFLLPFLDCSFPPLSYLLPIRSHSSFNPSEFSPPPHLIFCCEAPTTLMSPAARHHTASTSCTCALHRMPTPDSDRVLVRYPLWRPQPAPRSILTHEGFSHHCDSESLYGVPQERRIIGNPERGEM